MKVELINSIDQVFSSLIIFTLGLLILEKLRLTLKIKFIKSLIIYIYHTFFMFIYIKYTLNNSADSLLYFSHGITNSDIQFSIGTSFIYYLINILSVFNISYLGYFLLFNIFGSIGLLYFYGSLLQIVSNKKLFYRRLALIVVFLPSISFWSVSIGKDSIAFLSVGLMLWASLDLKKRKVLFILAVFCMFLIRPHIAAVVLLSLSLVIISGKDVKFFYKIIISSFLVTISYFAISFVIKYVGLESVQNINEVSQYVEKRQSYNQDGGGGIDISSMNIIEQVFTYLFRPLPFEAHSLSSLLASFDNLFLLFLFILFVRAYIRNKPFKLINYNFIFLYSVLLILILSSTTANLGIAVRQKWMFMPIVIFIWFVYICGDRKNKINNMKGKI